MDRSLKGPESFDSGDLPPELRDLAKEIAQREEFLQHERERPIQAEAEASLLLTENPQFAESLDFSSLPQALEHVFVIVGKVGGGEQPTHITVSQAQVEKGGVSFRKLEISGTTFVHVRLTGGGESVYEVGDWEIGDREGVPNFQHPGPATAVEEKKKVEDIFSKEVRRTKKCQELEAEARPKRSTPSRGHFYRSGLDQNIF